MISLSRAKECWTLYAGTQVAAWEVIMSKEPTKMTFLSLQSDESSTLSVLALLPEINAEIWSKASPDPLEIHM